MRRMTMFNLSERLSKHSSLCWLKNQEHTTRQTDYMAGDVKKFGFLKINFKNGVEKLWDILPKFLFFSLKTFFQWFWETFLYVVWLCSSYLRDCLNIVLYPGKKIRNVRHVKQIIWQETRKSLHFYFENGVEKLWGYPSKTTILDSKLFFSQALRKFSIRRMTMFDIFKLLQPRWL